MFRPASLRLLMLPVLIVALAGCGTLRLESPPPTIEPPTVTEQIRQRTAVDSVFLMRTAQAAAQEASGAVVPVLAAVADDAQVQAEALGGVWEPPGRHLSAPVPRDSPEAVLASLTGTATDARTAAVEQDGALALVLAGLAVSRSLRADQLTVALGDEPGTVQPDLPQQLDPAASAELVRTLDALGLAWEIRAARAPEEDEQAAAVAAAEDWRTQALQIATIAGVADTDEDPRQVSYSLDVDDLAATIAALRADLPAAWLAQVTTTQGHDRERVIDLALTAAREAGMAGSGAEVPPLLGLS